MTVEIQVTDIAVVIPCFNLGRFVVDAVDSVCAQTRPAAEIVVVDDGSTDLYTLQAVASLSRPSLRVVRAEHRGASSARNLGAGLTSSPYLLFLDADDLLESTYLEQAGASLDDDPHLVGPGGRREGRQERDRERRLESHPDLLTYARPLPTVPYFFFSVNSKLSK